MNRSPIFPYLLLFALTIAISFYFEIGKYFSLEVLFGMMITIMVLTIFSFKFLKSLFLNSVFIGVFFVLFGFFVVKTNMSNDYQSELSKLGYGKIVFNGVIDSEPKYNGEYLKFELNTNYLVSESGSSRRLSEKIMIYMKDGSEKFRMGDVIIITGRISVIKNKGNPGEFDYSMFMKKKGINYQMFSRVDQSVLSKNRNFSILSYANSVRRKMLKVIDTHINKETAPIAKAVLLGYKNEIDAETREHYAASGASHILAVSGMHVGILVLILTYINKLWARTSKLKVVASVILLLIVWSYVFITGFAPSIARAGFMFSFLVIGSILERTPSSLNVISLSAFVLLIINPLNLFDVGFQLSFAAIVGIFYFYPKFNKVIYIKNRLLRWLYQLSLVSISAQIATLPFTLFYFKQFPTYFLITNPVSTIGATLILVLGILMFVFSFWDFLSVLFGQLLNSVIECQNFLMKSVSDFKFSTIKILDIGVIQSILMVLLILILFFAKFSNRRISRVIKLALVSVFLLGVAIMNDKPNTNELIVLNSRIENLILKMDNSCYVDGVESKELMQYLNTKPDHEMVLLNNNSTLNWYHKGLMQIGGKRVLLLNSENNKLLNELQFDIIVCSKSSYIPKKITGNAVWVLPNSLSSKQRRIIEQILIANDQKIYDVQKEGAFQVNL